MPEDRLNGKPKCGKCGFPLVVKDDAAHPVDVTDATFSSEILLFPGYVLVDCWAPWCAPCRAVAPVLDELASKYAGGVKIAKLNIDENHFTASQYSVQNIPTMLFFRKGKLLDRLVGAFPKDVIERRLLAIFKTN
jgi:thioredoxin 2